jgi:peptidoglycan hydrolase-like protein with peptidoglycan-binding domain
VIRRGQPLFGVDGEPVILMYGELPAYRRLAEGVSGGEDVRQLEENLSALGYDPGTVDGEFTSAAAVSDWQDAHDLAETGSVELGRVIFLPGARRVTEVSATLGAAGDAGGLGAESSGDRGAENLLVAYQPSGEDKDVEPGDGEAPSQAGDEAEPGEEQPAPENTSPQDQPSQDQPSQDPSPQAPATTVPAQEATPRSEPATPSEDEAAPSVPVLETTSTRRIVTAELDPDQQDLARRGQRVQVTLPDGRQAAGRVTRLEAVESSSDQGASGGASEPGVEATIRLVGRGRIPALDGAAVSVTLTDRVRRNVLTVPLTALISIGANRFAVIARDRARRLQIVVTPGLAAGGFVEVEGEGLREGISVEAPQ